MEQKIKFIIIGLIGITAACLFLFIQSFGVKQQLTRERDEFKAENITLTAKIDKLTGSLRDYQSRISSLNGELEQAYQEKAELDKKYELANKEKEELVEKLKLQMQQPQVAAREPQQGFASLDNDAYWAGILKAKTDLEFQLGNVRNELKKLQIDNEQLQREKGAFELELNNLKREKDDLSRQVDYNKKLLDSLAQELVREKNDKAKIQDSYKIIRNENAVLSRQISSLNTRKADLERKLQGIQDEKGVLERRVSEMESMLTERSGQITSLKDRIESVKSGSATVEEKKESVELPAIVVKPATNILRGEEEPGVSLIGRVMAVNKESNFAIIDLGEDSGVKVGDSFRVYRNDKPIANIEAIQVRRNICACDIKNQDAAIRIGDTVR
jgi:predicted  nucleic acid-binding Zn-ribbon protein